MLATRHCLALSIAALFVAPPAFAGSTHLLAAGAHKEADLRGYNAVQVADFTDASQAKFDKPEDEAEHRTAVAEAGKRFADMIVHELIVSKGFEPVTREAPTGKGLRIEGRVLVYKESNAAARYIGLGIGGSEFDADVEVKDAESGKSLGTMKIEFGSSPLPGATNVVQTVGLLMDSAAQQFRDEMLIAKHVKHREETGRSGRAREKYKSGT